MWCYFASFTPIYIIAYYLMMKYRPIEKITGMNMFGIKPDATGCRRDDVESSKAAGHIRRLLW